jgi:hypothetical protein
VPTILDDATPIAFLRLGTCLLGLVLIEQVFQRQEMHVESSSHHRLGVLFG